ncbi:MAG TPA: helix-turn-helix domain-containing protein [Polyangiaceae bacterium]
MICWHRRGFAGFWTMQSEHIGRPPISAELIALIERMAAEDPLWSRRRIAGELAKLGHEVSKDTVAKYMPKRNGRPGRPQSTTWATFLRTHVAGTRSASRRRRSMVATTSRRNLTVVDHSEGVFTPGPVNGERYRVSQVLERNVARVASLALALRSF